MIIDLLKNLPKELSVFLITIAFSTIIILISHSIWQSSAENKQAAQHNLESAKQRYYTALDRKKLLEEFSSKYEQLTNSGIVGNEHRLNWVDIIERTTKNFQIPYLKYKIDKQKSITSPNLTQSYPGLDLLYSIMTLELQLLHEGDLYTVLNSLEKQAKGLFDVQNCLIVRNLTQSADLLDSRSDKNFSAKCTLNWYTMKKKSLAIPVQSDNRRRS